MNKTRLRQEAFRFLSKFGENIGAKFTNICGKTGSYSVPLELFQKRTPRKNRALISWKAVVENELSFEQLDTFEGGVVVEFVNNDFFDEKNEDNSLFQIIKHHLGSNDNVSSIISIKSEDGSSSSSVPRKAFRKLTDNTKVLYKGKEVTVTRSNFLDYALTKRIQRQGQGNNVWDGFLFISIRGGQQDTIETHRGQELTLFNPACEYASTDVCEDINLVMAYYALLSIDDQDLETRNLKTLEYKILLKNIENELEIIKYDFPKYKGNLLNYVKKSYSTTFNPGKLTDPIQVTPIAIEKFNIPDRREDSIDITHEEAVIHEKYYWDKEKRCVLSPARPTNLFWSYHLSNMMQQNYNLDEYFKYEEKRFKDRKKLIEKIKMN